jgi:hypothetical protein
MEGTACGQQRANMEQFNGQVHVEEFRTFSMFV